MLAEISTGGHLDNPGRHLGTGLNQYRRPPLGMASPGNIVSKRHLLAGLRQGREGARGRITGFLERNVVRKASVGGSAVKDNLAVLRYGTR